MKSRIALLLAIFFISLGGEARADDIDKLVRDLTTSKQEKVRLSAALALAKRGDERAIPAFLKALRDTDRNVRGVAAGALGKLVTGSTERSQRSRVTRDLARTAEKDPNSSVRERARKALAALKRLDSGPAQGGIFVDIGPMSAKAGSIKEMQALMRKTTLDVFAKHAKNVVTDWPGGRQPSQEALDSSKTAGFHVDGTLVQLSSQPKGSGTEVSCKISMLIATYPAKSMFGFSNASAHVMAGKSAKDIAYAEQDCVAAVVENLVTQKIIPAIKTRAPVTKAAGSTKSRTPRSRRSRSSSASTARKSSQ